MADLGSDGQRSGLLALKFLLEALRLTIPRPFRFSDPHVDGDRQTCGRCMRVIKLVRSVAKVNLIESNRIRERPRPGINGTQVRTQESKSSLATLPCNPPTMTGGISMNRWNLLESDLHRLMPARSFTGSGPSLESKVNPNESDEGIRESTGVRPSRVSANAQTMDS
jgi:hypothetical protein